MSTEARPGGPMWTPAAIEVAADPGTARAPRRTRARNAILVVFIGHLIAFCGAGWGGTSRIRGRHRGDCLRSLYRARTVPALVRGGKPVTRPVGRTGVRPGADGGSPTHRFVGGTWKGQARGSLPALHPGAWRV